MLAGCYLRDAAKRGCAVANEKNYNQQWADYLSYGYRVFSEELLTPGIALIVSPDGRKIIVIGDDDSNSPYEYDEQEQVVYVNLRNRGIGASFICPACGQSYIFSLDGCKQVSDGTISIHKNGHLFECGCGVVFVFNDRYEFLFLPF
jgi:hypothetical protein